MKNYCTLFDRNYLYKGLTLYFSLKEHAGDFKLYILCMDDITLELLTRMSLPQVELISLAEFENEALLKAKKERTVTEYSWTCTSSLCYYMLQQKKVDHIIYLDADLFFFNDPQTMFEEIDGASIAIIEHRSPIKKYDDIVGKYNVGLIYFKNDDDGYDCCQWWAERVLEWCFYRYEDGKYGDQLYLNDWPTRFKNVRVIKHDGVGIAPWNLKVDYHVSQKDGKLFVNDLPLIFYHFHAFYLLRGNDFGRAVGYFIPKQKGKLIYPPYIEQIKKSIEFVSKYDSQFHYGYKELPFKYKMMNLVYNKIVPEKIIFFLTRIKYKIMNNQYEKAKNQS